MSMQAGLASCMFMVGGCLRFVHQKCVGVFASRIPSWVFASRIPSSAGLCHK